MRNFAIALEMNIFCTERTQSIARIRFVDPSGGRIQGSIRGPVCRHSRTLTSKQTICDGEVAVVDPCYWTPKLPFRYDVQLQVETANGQQELEFPFGIRGCIPHRDTLRVEGKGAVVRAIEPSDPANADLADLRESLTAMVVQHAVCPESVYRECSEMGVTLIVETQQAMTPELAHTLNGYPAVFFVRAAGHITGTDLLSIGTAEDNSDITSTQEHAAAGLQASTKPIFATRQLPGASPLEMRAACDQLQRDLAEQRQFAGYVIRQ